MAASKDTPNNEGDFFSLVGEAFKMIGKSWEALKLNLLTFILVSIAPVAVVIAGAMLSGIILAGSSEVGSDGVGVAGLFFSMFIMVVALVAALVFVPAITITQLESVKGNKVEFGEVFEKSKKFVLRYIGIGILTGLIVVIPTLLMFFTLILIPVGIAWAILAGFFLALTPYILVDKDLGIIETIKASYETTKKHWKWVLAAYVVLIVISIPGSIPVLQIIGWIPSLILSIAYFCLMPLVYVTKIKKS